MLYWTQRIWHPHRTWDRWARFTLLSTTGLELSGPRKLCRAVLIVLAQERSYGFWFCSGQSRLVKRDLKFSQYSRCCHRIIIIRGPNRVLQFFLGRIYWVARGVMRSRCWRFASIENLKVINITNLGRIAIFERRRLKVEESESAWKSIYSFSEDAFICLKKGRQPVKTPATVNATQFSNNPTTAIPGWINFVELRVGFHCPSRGLNAKELQLWVIIISWNAALVQKAIWNIVTVTSNCSTFYIHTSAQ